MNNKDVVKCFTIIGFFILALAFIVRCGFGLSYVLGGEAVPYGLRVTCAIELSCILSFVCGAWSCSD